MSDSRPLLIAALAWPGTWFAVEDSIQAGIDLAAGRADFVDIGVDAVTPAGEAVDVQRARGRITAVTAGLVAAGVRVSVQTTDAQTALLAVDQGATCINDLSGGTLDRLMPRVAAESGATYVAGDWHPTITGWGAGDLRWGARADRLRARADALVAAGLDADRLVLNPGFRLAEEDLPSLAQALDFPLMVEMAGDEQPYGTPVTSLLEAAWAARPNVWGVRLPFVAPAVPDTSFSEPAEGHVP